jgi:hypothetical protein
MASFGTNVTAIKYMANALQGVARKSMVAKVTNQDFYTPGGEDPKSSKVIRSKNQKFAITSLHSNGWSSYSGSNLSFATVKESVSTLTINVYRALQDSIPSLAMFTSSVNDPQSTIMQSATDKLVTMLDKALFALYSKAGSGNWVGTSYVTGTVAIDASGNVTGTGTTFAAAMAGRPFKAAGHTKWYRVKTYTSATAIVVEDDLDDETSTYTGGVISAGAAYEIQAATKLAITKSNIAQYISTFAQMLDESHGDNDELVVPREGRFLILPAIAETPLRTASEFNRDIEMVYKDNVKEGVVARAYGLDIFFAPTSWFTGDNTNGYYCIGGHTSWITVGYGFIEPITLIPSAQNQTNFGDLIKGLFGWGFKVADDRRIAGGVFYATFA